MTDAFNRSRRTHKMAEALYKQRVSALPMSGTSLAAGAASGIGQGGDDK